MAPRSTEARTRPSSRRSPGDPAAGPPLVPGGGPAASLADLVAAGRRIHRPDARLLRPRPQRGTGPVRDGLARRAGLALGPAGGLPDPEGPRHQPDEPGKGRARALSVLRDAPVGKRSAACASCHQQDRAFTDDSVRSAGATGEVLPRSAPSLANVVYNARSPGPTRARHPGEADRVPLFSEQPVEMGITDATRRWCSRRLRRDARYRAMFAAAFPGQGNPIALANVIKAIASFQRTLISGDSQRTTASSPAGHGSPPRDAGQEPLLRREGRVQPLSHQLQPQRSDRVRRQARRQHPVSQHRALQPGRHGGASRRPTVVSSS